MDATLTEVILEKIRNRRKEKGFTLENMADELHISHSAYRKIETNQCKLSVDILVQIAEVLETPVTELLDEMQSKVYNQNNNDSGTFIGHQEFENFYEANKELTQNYVTSLQDEISHLRSEIVFLRELIKQKDE